MTGIRSKIHELGRLERLAKHHFIAAEQEQKNAEKYQALAAEALDKEEAHIAEGKKLTEKAKALLKELNEKETGE